MKEKYAISLGLPISQNATCEITIGSGNQVTTTGTATVPFRLSSENEVHNLEFQLLPNCIHDVIIGKPFLKLTRTFSNVVNFYRRVKKRFAKGISQFHLLYLGASTPMFEGSINGQAYARSIGVHIHTRHEYQTRLKFADNSVTETAGMAYDVEWRFGHDDEFTSPYPLDFHILKNAPANVVLSDSFLFDTKAFPQYLNVTSSSLADLRYLELGRHGEEADRISTLPGAKGTAAQTIEDEQCAEWDRKFAAVRAKDQLQKLQLLFAVA
ncbi:hypothetical protein DTO013E5_8891 [Penicillium roqueforti]|nr:hypothetical protein CBS147337_8938 [Penicillium roqueforti]KAI2672315.1 hypothetical protein LCP963914a_9440 [Penicillium roqueforti]KAI2696420.1 hypothetical protein CBS147372_8523 [Penicillium roqueforti]KAI2699045.1 hypothetical protein CBS147354_9838 [Penicillium roqueforti]KAI2723997.1 hypothetical protein CBS147318_928 [Penicillium roqueforti]